MIKPNLSSIRWLAGALAITSSLACPGEPLKIVASIKPIALIIEAVSHGVAPVDTLLKPGASPHSYSMKPSDARILNEADLVFWIGSGLEVFLEKVLSNSDHVHSVPLMSEAHMALVKHDEEGRHNEHGHHGGQHHHDDHKREHHHHHGEYDPHVWLSPDNAIAIAQTIADRLSEMDPEHKDAYQKNLNTFEQSVKAADKANIKKLERVHNKPMFVFHDAYSYLKSHYNLNIVNHFTIGPEVAPGARHLDAIQNQIKAAGKSCIFREPQFQPRYLDRILDGTHATVKSLDPLASTTQAGPEGYVNFLNEAVDAIVDCFEE